MLLRSGITKGLLVLYKACVGLNLDKIQVLLFYETDFMQFNAILMALTAALAMTLGTAPAEQPGYAGHFICFENNAPLYLCYQSSKAYCPINRFRGL